MFRIPHLPIIMFCLFTLSLQAAIAQDQVSVPGFPKFRADTTDSPVVLVRDTLFLIHHPVGIYSSSERAKRINMILKELLERGDFEVDSMEVFASDENHYILYKGLPLMAVYPFDTTGLGITPAELAQNNFEAIRQGFLRNQPAYNLKVVTRNLLYTGIITVLVILVVVLLNWIFRKINLFLDARKERFFKGWNIRNYPIFDTAQQYKFTRNLLGIVKIGLIILIVFIAFPVIFTMFPATEGITRKLISLVWNPVNKILIGVVKFIPNLITILIIFIVFRLIIRGLKFLADEIGNEKLVIPGFYPEWGRPTYMIVRFILYIFMFIMIFPFLPGSDTAIFQGVSVFVGLLISIGSSNAIANAVAGLVITYMRPFKIGDRIRIDDITGDVTEKSALVTRIRTIKNEDITIPNSKVLTSHTINYSAPARETGLIIHTTVTIGYDAPWRTVHSLLIEAAQKTPGVLKTPPPFVLQTSLDDFYISYQVNIYVGNASGMLKIKSDLHQNIQDSFNRGGVEIMSPHYRSERDGNEVTIPKNWEPGIDAFEKSTAIPPAPPAKKRGRKPKAT